MPILLYCIRAILLKIYQMAKDNEKDDKKSPPAKLTGTERQRAFISEIMTRNPVGAPRMYKDKEELETQLTAYFTYCYEERIKLTITGLVLFLGFADRRSFYDYEQKPEFAHTIKKARTLIEMHYEGLLQEAFPQGAQFALKNLGWNAEEQIEKTIKKKTVFYVGGDPDAPDDQDQDQTPALNQENKEFYPFKDVD